MKLGLAIGYSGAHVDVPVALVQRAQELGYDSVWSAEASAHRRASANPTAPGRPAAWIRSACDRASPRPSR
jgi:alkanesulfonate monooxygenase SsuD/methylene tetrahydromethanopterin reductase-like flavin-dependent oxidoreductase (luciferase family)